MNAQEILENLAKLESNLRNIDSARKQVETLSNSYDATEKQLKSLASEMTSIVNDLNIIFKTIKSNNELTSREIDTKVNEVIQALLTKITGIQTEVDRIKKTFNQECTSITNQLQTSASNSLDAIQNGVSGIISTLNTKANEEIERCMPRSRLFRMQQLWPSLITRLLWKAYHLDLIMICRGMLHPLMKQN